MPEIAEIFRDHHKEYFRRNNAPPEVIRTILTLKNVVPRPWGTAFSALVRIADTWKSVIGPAAIATVPNAVVIKLQNGWKTSYGTIAR